MTSSRCQAPYFVSSKHDIFQSNILDNSLVLLVQSTNAGLEQKSEL